MAALSLYRFETNLMSNRKVIELVLQLKSAKALGKNYIKIKSHLVRHLLYNRPLHAVYRTFLSPCGFIVFGPYTLQKSTTEKQ